MSNIYKRLQTVRAKLQKVEIKESGNNKFAGYTYMELGDFLPIIVDLCNEHGLCTVVSFSDLATLTIINSDKPEEQVMFTSPMSTAELKGCHAIQNLGAVETYLRRYLYVNAFDIVEHDALDSTHGKDVADKKPQQQAQKSAQAAAPAGKDAEYIQRIKDALLLLFGDMAVPDNKKAALDVVEEDSAWIDKDTGEVKRKGTRDFTKLKGDPLKWLCHKIETRANKFKGQ